MECGACKLFSGDITCPNCVATRVLEGRRKITELRETIRKQTEELENRLHYVSITQSQYYVQRTLHADKKEKDLEMFALRNEQRRYDIDYIKSNLLIKQKYLKDFKRLLTDTREALCRNPNAMAQKVEQIKSSRHLRSHMLQQKISECGRIFSKPDIFYPSFSVGEQFQFFNTSEPDLIDDFEDEIASSESVSDDESSPKANFKLLEDNNQLNIIDRYFESPEDKSADQTALLYVRGDISRGTPSHRHAILNSLSLMCGFTSELSKLLDIYLPYIQFRTQEGSFNLIDFNHNVYTIKESQFNNQLENAVILLNNNLKYLAFVQGHPIEKYQSNDEVLAVSEYFGSLHFGRELLSCPKIDNRKKYDWDQLFLNIDVLVIMKVPQILSQRMLRFRQEDSDEEGFDDDDDDFGGLGDSGGDGGMSGRKDRRFSFDFREEDFHVLQSTRTRPV
eukprot:CAMPEP_0115011778 /NCGR_PEP_ID=MMETSP0216-20121206/24275_1 /TAXON_ID=223996 /ORGANISM="Protocruzia adherens, Strain Boccale" /LENGTH=448 /DNA_ID=CAMNT_0002380571 /DNA_START=46 /DNA_END=1392 /DNA_ORIENTATION=-